MSMGAVPLPLSPPLGHPSPGLPEPQRGSVLRTARARRFFNKRQSFFQVLLWIAGAGRLQEPQLNNGRFHEAALGFSNWRVRRSPSAQYFRSFIDGQAAKVSKLDNSALPSILRLKAF